MWRCACGAPPRLSPCRGREVWRCACGALPRPSPCRGRGRRSTNEVPPCQGGTGGSGGGRVRVCMLDARETPPRPSPCQGREVWCCACGAPPRFSPCRGREVWRCACGATPRRSPCRGRGRRSTNGVPPCQGGTGGSGGGRLRVRMLDARETPPRPSPCQGREVWRCACGAPPRFSPYRGREVWRCACGALHRRSPCRGREIRCCAWEACLQPVPCFGSELRLDQQGSPLPRGDRGVWRRAVADAHARRPPNPSPALPLPGAGETLDD